MGLLRDYLIKNPKTKTKVTVVIHILTILVFLSTIFLHTFDNLAFEQGYNFGGKTCIVKLEDYFFNVTFNETEGLDVIEGYRET